jgi:P4 family phage/plasmid primase-like protien
MSTSNEPVLNLHPDDLANLQRSGLTDATIASLGCFSAEADTIQARTGVAKVESPGYAIPYQGIIDQTGEPYVRWRLRQPIGKMRYAAGKGDDAQLYIPPALAALPPADLLVVTEGEKKAAKAVQEGIHCVAVQGVWSGFDAEGRAAEKMRGEPVNDETAPLPELVKLAKGYRGVLVLGDSDLLSNPPAKVGFERLARSLAALGIRAAVAYCPPATVVDGEEKSIKKQGLDDWLIADRFHAVRGLPALFFASVVNRDGITDNDNALQFTERFKNQLAFSQGIWRCWNGTIWAPDECGKRLALVPSLAKFYHAAADNLKALRSGVLAPYRSVKRAELPSVVLAWSGPVESAIKEIRDAAKHISNLRGIEATLALAQPHLWVPDDAWDRDPYLLAVENGVVDLRTAKLIPALPDQRITRCAGAAYDPSAATPKFLNFLQQVQPDAEVREYLQLLAGYCAVGRSNEQEFYSFVGPGANGKGTYMGLLMDALGKYAVKGPQSLLSEQSPDKPRNDVAALAGARLVSISETPENLRLDVAMIKAITGDDLLTARFLHREFFQFRPCFTPILDTNHAPRPRDPGNAIWRRLVIVPWSVVIPKHQQDKQLRSLLLDELPGILNWIVQGAKKYLEGGLTSPRKIAEATRYLRNSCDDIGNWMDSCVELGPQYRGQSSVLYQNFLTWSAAEGITNTVSQVAFSNNLEERGFVSKKGNGGKSMWLGLRLRTSNEGNQEPEGCEQARPESTAVSTPEPTSANGETPSATKQSPSISNVKRLPGGGCKL